MALKQDGVHFTVCPQQARAIKLGVLSQTGYVSILAFLCPKQEQNFKHWATSDVEYSTALFNVDFF